MPEDDDKWAKFETYKGPPEPKFPKSFDYFAKFFIYLVGLAIVFGFSGAFLLIIAYRLGPLGRKFALIEEPWMAWTRFIVGGIIGVYLVIRWWKRPIFGCGDQATSRRRRKSR